MPTDKYTAIWASHSSISDFLECPRAYYLKNVYKDPKTNHKIQLISPPLALGQAVHEVVESLSVLPVDRRFDTPLTEKFEKVWKKISGRKGGFLDEDTEVQYKRRGEAMLRRVTKKPGPVGRLAVKIQMDLPHYWLSEEDNIILCGKIDWLEYIPDSDSVNIVDFKTSKSEERENSMQLPIYHLLVHNCQKHKVDSASYWYLEREDKPTKKKLPDLEKSYEEVLKVAKKMKLARQLDSFKCPKDEGCHACNPYEAILRGEGELVGTSEYNQDVYILEKPQEEAKDESVIL